MTECRQPLLYVHDMDVRLGGRLILREVSLAVDANTTMAVTGASGCGKTTLLRAIAGLIAVERGRIEVCGENVKSLAANRRGIVYMNQEPLLFPHLNLFENIAFGLRLQRKTEAEIRERVAALIVQLELDGLQRRHTDALSGGQRQRVAFGRALAVDPRLLLLDEPFSNLDSQTRAGMQDLFKRVCHQRAMTALFVTHDLKESIKIGDRFAMIRDGSLHNYADRRAFCADPANGVGREIAFWQAFAADADPQD